MLKILSIGNSFSQNAQRYLKGIADAAGIEIYNANLYIGGCSFERHIKCLHENLADYSLEIGGHSTGRYVTVSEGLALEDWDIVTLQEASPRSYKYDEFAPYLEELAAYVRKTCPRAKIALHMTWGYGSEERLLPRGFGCQRDMYERIKIAYASARKLISADMVIPSGEIMQLMTDAGLTVHDDGAHASRGIGEYGLGLCWLRKLFGVSVKGNSFRETKIQISEEDIALIQELVDKMDLF